MVVVALPIIVALVVVLVAVVLLLAALFGVGVGLCVAALY